MEGELSLLGSKDCSAVKGDVRWQRPFRQGFGGCWQEPSAACQHQQALGMQEVIPRILALAPCSYPVLPSFPCICHATLELWMQL